MEYRPSSKLWWPHQGVRISRPWFFTVPNRQRIWRQGRELQPLWSITLTRSSMFYSHKIRSHLHSIGYLIHTTHQSAIELQWSIVHLRLSRIQHVSHSNALYLRLSTWSSRALNRHTRECSTWHTLSAVFFKSILTLADTLRTLICMSCFDESKAFFISF